MMTVLRSRVVGALGAWPGATEDGVIMWLGLPANCLPASFFRTFFERLLEAAPEESRAEVQDAIRECAREYVYHWGHAVLSSEEYQSRIAPMVTDGARDLLRAATAVFSSCGWAKAGLARLDAGSMAVRVDGCYELVDTPAQRPLFLEGACSAMYELACCGDYPTGLGASDCDTTHLSSQQTALEIRVTKRT